MRGFCHETYLPEGVIQTSSGPLFEAATFWKNLIPAISKLKIQLPKHMSDVEKEFTLNTQAIGDAMRSMEGGLELLKPLKKNLIDECRSMRMASAKEVADTLKPLEDIRKFFLGNDHEKEIQRLREFVELCERLQSLKSNGTLDAVADTMLKLA